MNAYERNISAVCDLLIARGYDATYEYPGYIAVDGWSFGTADDVWGGEDNVEGGDVNTVYVTSIIEPSDAYGALEFIETTLATQAMIESLERAVRCNFLS